MSSNYIKNIAIIGAGGNSGRYMTEAILQTGKHMVTALTRSDSTSKLPDGVVYKSIDYSKPETIVEALRGQDALIITLSAQALDAETTIIKAAAEAGVPWVLPNEWSPDSFNEKLVEDVFIFKGSVTARKLIEDLGRSSYLAVVTGFWYEWSLSIPPAYGFDFEKRTVTFFDDGETKICTSTWPQVGRAVAALLSLPINSEDSNAICLEKFKNQAVYINSFAVSQRDMLASVLRVTKTQESEWAITKEPAKERYTAGIEAIKKGDRIGFAKMLYTRIFFEDGIGNYTEKGLANAALGLKEESLDEATERAWIRSKEVKEHWHERK